MGNQAYGDIMRILKREYREVAASEKATPWESLLFTLLSARTRDVQTEIAFRKLMHRYPSVKSLAEARVKDVGRVLQTIGLYRNKARFVVDLAKRLRKEHGGRIPDDIETLVGLPGVGRKTANCVMVYAFGEPAVCVDTHVHRICNRLGWVRTKDATKTEESLRATLPKSHWLDVNRVMVQFGRDICVPITPKCWMCPVRRYCGFGKKTRKPR